MTDLNSLEKQSVQRDNDNIDQLCNAFDPFFHVTRLSSKEWSGLQALWGHASQEQSSEPANDSHANRDSVESDWRGPRA